MNRHEKKALNTKRKILGALALMIEKKPFTDITVSELCRKAEVNRTTFYAHFHSTADALDLLEEELINDFLKTFQAMDDPRLTQPNLMQKQTLIPYLEYVRSHQRDYKLYNSLSIFRHDLHRDLLLEKVFIPALARFGQTDRNRIEYMADYYLGGINAIIGRWVDRDCADDIDAIYDVLLSCVMGTSTYIETVRENNAFPVSTPAQATESE